MKFPYPALTAVFLTNLLPVEAQPAEILTYESVPARIRHGNPELAAARHRIGEALGRLKQAGRLPNPSLQTGLSHNVRNAEGGLEIGISQKFPLTNRLALEKEIGIAGVKAAEAEVKNVERLLAAEARAEFVKTLAVRERRALLLEQKSLADGLADFISGASARGELSKLDAAQTRLAALRLTTEERRLEAEETASLGRLRPLLGIAAGTPVSLSGKIPTLSLPGIAAVSRPDLDAMNAELDAANTGITLERARRRDDIEASVFAAGERVEDAPVGLENEGMIGIRLSLPLPFWNDNQGAIDEATARQGRKREELNALLRDIDHTSDTARAEMRQWAALVSEIDASLLPLARTQTELLEDAYRKGQGDLQAVIRSREQILELQASRIDAAREFRLAHIRYQAATGQP
ncbi:TolC family protein [Akkermansiaceae bacterium]|nr:TolC family protein [Akkermansiaceae bacterium]